VQRLVREFKEFFFEGNVIELAVAIIVGGLFLQIVQALVRFILMPIIGIIFGKPNFDDALVLTINHSQIRFGAFLTVTLTVVLTALAVFFFIVKPYRVYRDYRRRNEQVTAPQITEIQLLAEIRDELRARPR
jgi:large conductance mechanosensitive channel